MAISAVNSVSFRNNYNNIQFEGGKKSKGRAGKHRHLTAPMKAVPLAVLLAMSPLNTVQAQNNTDRPTISVTSTHSRALSNPKVVDSKSFSMPEGFFDDDPELYFYYLDNDGNKASVEQVEVIHSETSCLERDINTTQRISFNDIYGIVKSLNNCNYNIVGDDGKSIGIWSFSYATLTNPLEAGDYLMRPDIVNSVKEFASSSKNNGAVEIRNINKNAVVWRSGMSTLRSVDLSWIDKTRKNNYNFGSKIREVNFETDNGEYAISFYSSDSNSDDCETVILERSDGLRCKLDGLRELKIQIASPDFYNGEYAEVGCIDVSWPNVGKYTILDDNLYDALFTVKQKHPEMGKAYTVRSQKDYMELTDSGNMFKH